MDSKLFLGLYGINPQSILVISRIIFKASVIKYILIFRKDGLPCVTGQCFHVQIFQIAIRESHIKAPKQALF